MLTDKAALRHGTVGCVYGAVRRTPSSRRERVHPDSSGCSSTDPTPYVKGSRCYEDILGGSGEIGVPDCCNDRFVVIRDINIRVVAEVF